MTQQPPDLPQVIHVTIPRTPPCDSQMDEALPVVLQLLQRTNPGCCIRLSTSTPDACTYRILPFNTEQHARMMTALDTLPKDWQVESLVRTPHDPTRPLLVLTFPAGRQFVLLPLWRGHPECHVTIAEQTDTTMIYHITPATTTQYAHIKKALVALAAGNADWHLVEQAPSADTTES